MTSGSALQFSERAFATMHASEQRQDKAGTNLRRDQPDGELREATRVLDQAHDRNAAQNVPAHQLVEASTASICTAVAAAPAITEEE